MHHRQYSLRAGGEVFAGAVAPSIADGAQAHENVTRFDASFTSAGAPHSNRGCSCSLPVLLLTGRCRQVQVEL